MLIALFLLLLLNACSNNDQRSKEGQTTQEIIQEDLKDKLAQKILAVDIPDQAMFCGEPVLTDIPDVKERLDRELLVNSYWHSNSIQLFKIANRYFPIIEKILIEEGVPADLRFIALAESGLKNVVSPRGAAGPWQFLKGTAKDYDLEVSSTVDERYHLEKSTRAAAQYLKKAKEDLGSWTLATASYNIGKARLKRIMKQQQQDNYYRLYLNEETSRYVLRIVAMKELFTSPDKYGFNLDKADLYAPYETYSVKVDTTVDDLADFAADFGITYKELKILNPWLRDVNLRNRRNREYFIKLPKN